MYIRYYLITFLSDAGEIMDTNNNDTTDLIASFDSAWPKRGRQHNSLSGKLQAY